jgi:hypothetical protein
MRARTRWSFGGAAPIDTAAGKLYPGALVAGGTIPLQQRFVGRRGPDHAALDASLIPTEQTQDRLALPPPPISSSARAARGEAIRDLAGAIIAAVALTDDQGTTYALHVEDIQHYPDLSPGRGQVSLRLGVDPVPARERGWLELRGRDGSAARLVPSPRPDVRVSRLAPVPEGPAARELSEWALWLAGLQLIGAGRDEVERDCSAALAMAAAIQQSGEPGLVGDLSGQLARLCAYLTGHGPADGLPSGWSSIINAANRADGVQQHLDISATLPAVEDIVVRVDSLVSEPETWRVYLRADPSWWIYSADGQLKRAVMSVHAEDDLGGMYLSLGDGGTGHGDHEELTLRFLPRLNPLARALTLTFTHAAEQVTIGLRLP